MRFQFLALVLTAVVSAGCGGGPNDMPEIGTVTGVVKVDGTPTPNLIVSFQPEGGRPAVGTTNAEGRYELTYSSSAKGTKIGKNMVSISTDVTDEDYEAAQEEEAETETDSAESIPAKYNEMAFENPDMTVSVKPGENEFNWDVVTK